MLDSYFLSNFFIFIWPGGAKWEVLDLIDIDHIQL